jgi:RHS repeat-associated protein
VDCWAEVYVENLGSVPVWFDDLEIAAGDQPVAVVVQETHYDPWGLELAGIGYVAETSKEHKWTYNGKEKQDQFGLGWLDCASADYHARQVDPALGRMWAVDPLAGKFAPVSPWSYALNNPLRFVDPTGMEVTAINGGTRYTGDDARLMGQLLQAQERQRERLIAGQAYISFWTPQQSETGVGHASIAIPSIDLKTGEQNKNDKGENLFDYYTYYPDKDGAPGGRKLTGATLTEALGYDVANGMQQQQAAFVLMADVTAEQAGKMSIAADNIIGQKWSLFGSNIYAFWNTHLGLRGSFGFNQLACGAGNCADITKEALRAGGFETGRSFGFSTPTDLFENFTAANHHSYSLYRGDFDAYVGALRGKLPSSTWHSIKKGAKELLLLSHKWLIK